MVDVYEAATGELVRTHFDGGSFWLSADGTRLAIETGTKYEIIEKEWQLTAPITIRDVASGRELARLEP